MSDFVDTKNIKIAIMNIYQVLEGRAMLSPAQKTKAIEDVVALVGVENVLDVDKKAMLKDNTSFDKVVAKLKKQGRIE